MNVHAILPETLERYNVLKKLLEQMEQVIVAYSGGVDSSFLLKVAFNVKGDRARGVLAVSPSFPSREFERAMNLAKDIGIHVKVIRTRELEDPRYRNNPVDRCYFCKRELFDKIKMIAKSEGYSCMVDGTNADDMNDHRPGMKALHEKGVRSPLREAGLSKQDIRNLSKSLGLPTWDKDEMACLSSRFPYGEKITIEKLTMVETMENFLSDLGFRNIRARHIGNSLKIEVDQTMVARLQNPEILKKVKGKATSIGYTHITVDPTGYRRGSLNRTGMNSVTG